MPGSSKQGNVLQFRRPNQQPSYFPLRMTDDSMRDAGYRADEVLTFRRTSDYEAGDTVAVETPDGTFVKIIHPAQGNFVILYGAHERCRPRMYHRSQVEVLGVLAVPNAAYG